jgi:hypothetical protein
VRDGLKIQHSIRRRLVSTALGFVFSYVAVYSLFLVDAMESAHFEALYETARPRGMVGWLGFQHASEGTFLTAGFVGAVIGFAASLARSRGGHIARTTQGGAAA